MPNITCSICLEPGVHSTSEGLLCEGCNTALNSRCRRCEGIYPSDDMIYHDGPLCRVCFNFSYGHCHECGSVKLITDLNAHNDYYYYCNRCSRSFGTVCDICDARGDSHVSHYIGNFCQSCFDEHVVSCHHCGNHNLVVNTTEIRDGESLCLNCELDHYEWPAQAYLPGGSTYTEVGSELSFGIEIETSRCLGFNRLRDNTLWACTNDYSISGKEFVSPPLHGDGGLNEIRDFCSYAVDHGWESDSRCGLHLHIGLGDFEPQELKSLAYAYHITYPLWSQFISEERSGDSMCGRPRYSKSEIEKIPTEDYEGWEYFVAERDRFDAINWRAFLVHGTIELRLLNGTLDSELICNWIKAHTRFIDFVTKQSIDDLYLFFCGDDYYQFTALTEIIGTKLANYYSDLASGFSNSVRPNEACLEPF